MQDILDFLNRNAGALNAVFSGIVMIATAVYAVLTWLLVAETRRMRQIQTEPAIHVAVESAEVALNLMRLHVKNIGLGPAKDVRVSLCPLAGGDAAGAIVKDFGESNFFKTGLANLGPGQERYSHYTNLHENGDNKLNSSVAADVSYASSAGKTYTHRFIIDLSEYKGHYTLGTPPLQAIAKALEQMEKNLGHAASGFKRLKIDVYTGVDRQHEREELDTRFGRRSGVRRLRRRR